MAIPGAKQFPVRRVRADGVSEGEDTLAVEEPLEIRLAGVENSRAFDRVAAVTMRTPGHDAELAQGFLFTEDVLRDPADILTIEEEPERNIVRVFLRHGPIVDWVRLERHAFQSSSCGLCGKKSIEALRPTLPYTLSAEGPPVSPSVLHALPQTLRAVQPLFHSTGGLHASALFTQDGDLLCVREDVGRHNALDKLIGQAWQAGCLPLSGNILIVSGRASFELVQKALMAGLPVLASIGAPSSLAVELARASGMTLIGFLRPDRFNIYSGAWRVE